MSLKRLTKSTRGKDAIINNNYHKYTFNSTGKNVKYWTSSKRRCKARISTRKSTGNLVGKSNPLHEHGNQKAKEHVFAVLDNLANVPAATTKAVLQLISYQHPCLLKSRAAKHYILCWCCKNGPMEEDTED